jgi:glycosyltransferase involved in cell wall biosynthesis
MNSSFRPTVPEISQSPDIKFSVAISAYNASATIAASLNSVFSQRISPCEILVLDDGSTDNTGTILESYGSRLTLFRQANRGIGHARNFLSKHASGDFVAFLDADDIWHPSYLRIQQALIRECPHAVAYFTEHENFTGYGDYCWKAEPFAGSLSSEVISPTTFIYRCNRVPLSFQLSGCCVPRKILRELGTPFCVTGSEDIYFLMLLALKGQIVHTSLRPVAYRITDSSLSANRLRTSLLVEDTFALLEEHYKMRSDLTLYAGFKAAYASRLRDAGKFLMGAGCKVDARKRITNSIAVTRDPVSLVKSLVLAFLTYLPSFSQPRWPSSYRPGATLEPHHGSSLFPQ